LGNKVLLTSYRHESGHYIVVPRVERTERQPIAREMEFLGELDLKRFAGDVQAKILKGGPAGVGFVCLSRREFVRVRDRRSELGSTPLHSMGSAATGLVRGESLQDGLA
jgi:hypothetical protein